jgi:predicted phage replisome organizer
MADVKWIKITTDIFDDEKILLIESLPDSYAIITVWFKLLCLAGKQNNSGVFMMGQIAYTDKMLATIFRMKESTVTMALQTFEQFGMIEIIDGVITIPNWGKHQNLDQMESRKEFMRNYMREYREKQKALTCKPNSKPNSKPNVRQAEEDIEEEIEGDIDIKDIISDSAESEPPAPKKKPVKHKYGEYKNVLLTDDELEKLKKEYPDYMERIERLSSYVASTGKSYKSHYATIRNWARKDAEKSGRKEMVPSWMKKNQFNNFPERPAEDMGDLEAALLGAPKTVANDADIRRRAEALKEKLGGA